MNQQHHLIEQVLFEELPKVIEACERCGVDYVLVGALAVRPYLARFARLTRDLDIVVRATEREKVLSALTLLGYHIQRAPGWAAATKQIGHVEFFVDLMDDTICEPATNQKYQVQVASVTMATRIQPVFEEFASLACMAPIVPLDDAIILKLLSGRDKDLIDLTALRRGYTSLAIGDILGSTVINLTLVMGTALLIKETVVDFQVFLLPLVTLLLVNSLLTYALLKHEGIRKQFGLIFILIYVVFLLIEFMHCLECFETGILG